MSDSRPIHVKEISGKRALSKFAVFPTDVLYKDHPYYVPSLISDITGTFDPKENPAYDFSEQVDREKALDRADVIMEQQFRISDEKQEEFIGRTFDVIVDGYDSYTDSYFGRTYMDAPEIDNTIVFTSGYEIEVGEIIPVEIFEKDEYSLIGEAV